MKLVSNMTPLYMGMIFAGRAKEAKVKTCK